MLCVCVSESCSGASAELQPPTHHDAWEAAKHSNSYLSLWKLDISVSQGTTRAHKQPTCHCFILKENRLQYHVRLYLGWCWIFVIACSLLVSWDLVYQLKSQISFEFRSSYRQHRNAYFVVVGLLRNNWHGFDAAPLLKRCQTQRVVVSAFIYKPHT